MPLALKDDIILFSNISNKLIGYSSGAYKGGTGPTPQDLVRRKINKAASLSNASFKLSNSDPRDSDPYTRASGVCHMNIDPTSSHREDKLSCPTRFAKKPRVRFSQGVSVNKNGSDYENTPLKATVSNQSNVDYLQKTTVKRKLNEITTNTIKGCDGNYGNRVSPEPQNKATSEGSEYVCVNKKRKIDIVDENDSHVDSIEVDAIISDVSDNEEADIIQTANQYLISNDQHASPLPRSYKRKTVKSKSFMASFQKACDEYNNYTIENITCNRYKVNNLRIGNYYYVTTIPNPSCSCLYFSTNEGKIICKHIIIVLMELGVPVDSDILIQTAYRDSDRNYISTCNRKKLSAQEIANYKSQLIPQESTAYLEIYEKKKLPGRRACCSGGLDKHTVPDGLVICLYSRYRSGQFSKPYTFRYCLNKTCFQRRPLNSTCKVLPSYLIGNKVDISGRSAAENKEFTVVNV